MTITVSYTISRGDETITKTASAEIDIDSPSFKPASEDRFSEQKIKAGHITMALISALESATPYSPVS